MKQEIGNSIWLLPSERQHLQVVATKPGEDLEPNSELPPSGVSHLFPIPDNDFVGSGELEP